MSNNEQDLEKIDTEDDYFDFVTGGAKVDTNIDPDFKETFSTQLCNCGEYEPSISKSCIPTCDNCKWSRSPGGNTSVTFCMKQKNETL